MGENIVMYFGGGTSFEKIECGPPPLSLFLSSFLKRFVHIGLDIPLKGEYRNRN
jgi:hypothetical protein